jgi:cation:H+ antiporter
VAPGGVAVPAGALRFDLPVMLGVSIACLPIFFVGHAIFRWEGALFLAYYAAYLLFLLLNATQHGALQAFNVAMAGFVLPITALTLAVRVWRQWRRESAQAPRGAGEREEQERGEQDGHPEHNAARGPGA